MKGFWNKKRRQLEYKLEKLQLDFEYFQKTIFVNNNPFKFKLRDKVTYREIDMLSYRCNQKFDGVIIGCERQIEYKNYNIVLYVNKYEILVDGGSRRAWAKEEHVVKYKKPCKKRNQSN